MCDQTPHKAGLIEQLPAAPRWRLYFRDYRSWLGLVISLLFLYLICRQIQFDQLIVTLASIKTWPLAPALLLYFCGVFSRALRWQKLLDPVKYISSYFHFQVICLGYMANNVLPFRIGELYRAHVMGKHEGISRSAVFSSIILERVFDGLVMLLFLGLLSLLLDNIFPGPITVITTLSLLLFGGLFAILLLLVFFRPACSRIIALFGRLLPHKINELLIVFYNNSIEGLSSLKAIRTIVDLFLLSTLSWLCEAATYYFLFKSMDIGLGYEVTLLLVAVINLGIMIPSSPGYIGTFEYFCVLSLSLFAISETLAFSYAILLHFLLFFPVTAVGFYYFLALKKSDRAGPTTDGNV